MIIEHRDLLFTGRGVAALFAILKTLDVENKTILLPVNICEIIYPVVIKAGFTPVFYDVNELSGNGGMDEIKKKYTGSESVLLAVHNFGLPLEIDKIALWASDNGVFLIEDVCNAIGGQYKSKALGTWGDAAIFSFGYAKIVEYGVGGACFLKDNNLKMDVKRVIQAFEPFSDIYKSADTKFQLTLKELRKDNNLQVPSVYTPLYMSYSDYLVYKIDDNMVSEIKELFDTIESNISDRAEKALRYRNEIKSKKVQHIAEVDGQVYWRYNLSVEPGCRQGLIEKLRNNSILVSNWYPPIVGLFEENYDKSQYAGSYSFSSRVINLFVDRRVSSSDISKTVEIINNI